MHPTFIQVKQVSVPERKETNPMLQPKQTWVLRHSTMYGSTRTRTQAV